MPGFCPHADGARVGHGQGPGQCSARGPRTAGTIGPRPGRARTIRVHPIVKAVALPSALLGLAALGLGPRAGLGPWSAGSMESAGASSIPLPTAVPSKAPSPGTTTPGGPEPAYRCDFNVATDAFTGAGGTASAIGWEGDFNSVVTCLGGTFLVQDGPHGYFHNEGFGIYDGSPTTWNDADGWLPAQVTTFHDDGAWVAITEFADRIVLARRSLRRGVQQGRGDQPDRTPGRRGSPGIARPRPDRDGTRRRRSPHGLISRLRRRDRPLRHDSLLAQRDGARACRHVRRALRPHENVLAAPARVHRPARAPRSADGGRLRQWVRGDTDRGAAGIISIRA